MESVSIKILLAYEIIINCLQVHAKPFLIYEIVLRGAAFDENRLRK